MSIRTNPDLGLSSAFDLFPHFRIADEEVIEVGE